jgi:hypothetical protein
MGPQWKVACIVLRRPLPKGMCTSATALTSEGVEVVEVVVVVGGVVVGVGVAVVDGVVGVVVVGMRTKLVR